MPTWRAELFDLLPLLWPIGALILLMASYRKGKKHDPHR